MPATFAPRARADSATTLPSAPEAPVTTTTFPSMISLQATRWHAPTLPPGEIDLQCSEKLRPNALSSEQTEVPMPDAPLPCDIAEELIRLRRPLPHLVRALRYQRKIKIVAIGSSRIAGEGDYVPYPYTLEVAPHI